MSKALRVIWFQARGLLKAMVQGRKPFFPAPEVWSLMHAA